MPTYEFLCEKCRKIFTQRLRLAGHEKAELRGPKCQGQEVRQQISTFQTKTSRKS